MRVPFADAAPRDLALYRAMVFGLLGVDAFFRPLGVLADLPVALLRPVGPYQLLPDTLLAVAFGGPALGALAAITVGSCALAATGVAFRSVGTLACAAATLHGAAARSFSHVHHVDLALLLCAWAAVLVAWAARGGDREAPRAALSGGLLVLLASYHLVGVHRLVAGGSAVYAADTLAYWAVSNAMVPDLDWLVPPGFGARLAQSGPAMMAAAAAFPVVTVLEVLAPVAFFARGFRACFLAVIIPFHVASLLLLDVFFPQNIVLLLLFAALDRSRGAPARGDRDPAHDRRESGA